MSIRTILYPTSRSILDRKDTSLYYTGSFLQNSRKKIAKFVTFPIPWPDSSTVSSECLLHVHSPFTTIKNTYCRRIGLLLHMPISLEVNDRLIVATVNKIGANRVIMSEVLAIIKRLDTHSCLW